MYTFSHPYSGNPEQFIRIDLIHHKDIGNVREGTLSVKEIPGTPGNESMIAIYFSSLDSSISREITLFGPTSIIASVGGSLGLFLGFSCLDATLSIVERVKGLFIIRRISR